MLYVNASQDTIIEEAPESIKKAEAAPQKEIEQTEYDARIVSQHPSKDSESLQATQKQNILGRINLESQGDSRAGKVAADSNIDALMSHAASRPDSLGTD